MTLKKTLTSFACLVALAACDSKNVEKSPDQIAMNGYTLEERVSEKILVDNAIEKIVSGSKKIKRIVDLARKLRDKDQREFESFSSIDLLVGISEELKSQMPESTDDKMIRFGRFTVPLSSLSDECKTIETRLTSEKIRSQADELEDKKSVIGQTLTYSIKSCGQTEFYDLATVQIEEHSVGFAISTAQIKNIIENLIENEKNIGPKCDVQFDTSKIVHSIKCSNLQISLSETETVLFRSLNYSSEDDVRLEGQGDMYVGSTLDATLVIEVAKGRKSRFEVKKVEVTNTP